MKRTLSLSFVICIMLSLLLLNGCNNALPVFSSTDKGITDGEVSYSYLPDGWTFMGRLSKPFCKLENGAVYYTDSTKQFVRRKKALFQDMDYAPLVQESFVLPDIHNADSVVNIAIYKRPAVALPENVKGEFLRYYDIISRGNVSFISDSSETIASVYFTFLSIDGLRYESNCYLNATQGKIWLSYSNGRGLAIDESSLLYHFFSESGLC